MPIYESKYDVGDEVWFILPHTEKTIDDRGFGHLVRRPIVCSGKISEVSINYFVSSMTAITYWVSYNYPLSAEFSQLFGIPVHEASFKESDLYPSKEEAVKAVEAEGLKVYDEAKED